MICERAILPTTTAANLETEAHRALAQFLFRSTPNGRFLYYCWSRSSRYPFMIRQTLSFVTCGTMAILQTPLMGLIGFALLFLSDVFDSIWMRRVWKRWKGAVVPDRTRMLTMAIGISQTALTGLVTIVMWYFSATGEVLPDMQLEFFGVAYLVGLGLNAGIMRPLVPTVAVAKMGIILGTFFVILIMVLLKVPSIAGWFASNAYLIASIFILSLVVHTFLGLVDRNYARNQKAREAILRNQVALAQANSEIALREQQARRLALIAESTSEAIFVTDADSRITWINAAFTTITGFEASDVLGRDPSEFLNVDETDPAAIAEIYASQKTGQKARVEILNRKKDGSAQWISTNITPVYDADGKFVMCVQVERDITEERRRTQQLADMNEEAKAAAKAKEQFFATMSHEIRTPMNGVLGMADLLSRTELTAEQQSYLAAIRQSGDALLGIINDILDLSKLQSGKVQVTPAAFDLTAVVSGVVTLLWPLAHEKGIKLEIDEGIAPPVWVMGDSGRIRQVLINLVGNAIKFTSFGGVVVRLVAGADDTYQITVTDTGIGVTQDRLAAIFDSFTQADSAIDRQYGGTGLGLTISRMLARAMGGDVTVVSRSGQGSIFTLTLPLPATAPIERMAIVASGPPDAVACAQQKRILIAEDNATNRLILRKMLEATQARMTEVNNGAEAISAYQAGRYDLLIMDMQMPVMDGLTAIRHIRAFEAAQGLPRCPIMVLSANVFQNHVQASYDAQCDDYLTKPVQRDALLDSVARLLGAGDADQALPGTRRLA
jgi:two-component system, sensor histidine kinase